MKKIVLILVLVVLTKFLSAQSSTCLSGNCQNGKGSMQTSYGVYEGQFVNGKMSGKGIMKQGDGAIYSGIFVNNQYNGKGAMKYANGDVYKGYWQNNMRHGNGIIEFADGRKFKGKFVNDVCSGAGVMFNAKGEEIEKKNYISCDFDSGAKTEVLEKSIAFVGSSGGHGTGFVIGNRYIVTNNHVVYKNFNVAGENGQLVPCEGIYVRMHDDINYKNVDIVYSDDKIDLAVLKIRDNIPFNYLPLVFAKKVPTKGERIFTIGHPIDQALSFSLSEGVVSAHKPIFGNQMQIQHTIPINGGNSGGPIFDSEGKVIGIIFAGLDNTQGINLGYDLIVRKEFLENFR
jgi:S1-C subfamily serine protease